ncbi:MAG: hypothetical protein ABI142_11070, partial [Bryocella sp.]
MLDVERSRILCSVLNLSLHFYRFKKWDAESEPVVGTEHDFFSTTTPGAGEIFAGSSSLTRKRIDSNLPKG